MKISSLPLVATFALCLVSISCGGKNKKSAARARPAMAVPAQATPQAPPAQVGQKVRTNTGLQYEVLRVGTGATPRSYDRVKVHYHGYLPNNGEVFDSSVERGEPIDFNLNQVIAGWTEGLQLMQEGAKYRFTIPHYLAYGDRGSPPKIGPRQTLMFDVELIQVIR